ncbi:aminopeptidase N-like isoform X1 [Penaeus chinensis]|uniref:aminopeptidase N-like isoform X1 n=1 Tax=Penaeus chinensis TaxID=139456 RepID=UPI001FB6335B|nr:aminopeptidase N-like isoform X1 [Penaeus chinensis]
MLLRVSLLCIVTSSFHTADGTTPRLSNEEPLKQTAATIRANEGGELDIRLPRSLRPLHYVIKLQPFINGNFSILGHVEVEMEVLEPTSNITLHMDDIITKNDTVKVFTLNERAVVGIKKQQYDPERQFYIAHLEKQLEKGEKYVLSMDFLGSLGDLLQGFYKSTYKDIDGTTKRVAATMFQPTDARRAFPCFDEPALKATFEVHLARETWMTSLSNMPLAETRPVEGQEGWVWDRFERSVPMSTYLVAFVVSDFSPMNSSKDSHVQFRVWARRSVIDHAKYTASIVPKILNFYEKYFNTPFPLRKQDMIALPELSVQAMENWGLITSREDTLLHNPRVSTLTNKAYLVKVMSHELAHNWFGNLVTPKWWDGLWLSEGFATYIGILGMDYAEPTWKVLETLLIETLHGVMKLDSLATSHKIFFPVGRPEEIRHIFDGISYRKGASIIRMMSHFLGESAFRKGLTNFLGSFKYTNAEQDDLWEHLTAAAHQDGTLPRNVTVKTIMDTWTLQKGFPVIQVTRSFEGTSATISQGHILQLSSEERNISNTHDSKWWVPLTYTCRNRTNFNRTQAMVWMKASEDSITITSLPSNDEWVIFNLQETGYYRVNYDEHNWGLLIQQLKDDHEVIHVINRAQIIDDAMNLARNECILPTGHLNYTIAFDVYSYLGKETAFPPWLTAINNLQYITRMFRGKSGFGALKHYLLKLTLPLYKAVGFDDKAEDPYLLKEKRRLAIEWACDLGHGHCLQQARALYRRWMLDPANESIISSDIKPTVYCHAIAEGREAEWDFAWRRYLETDVSTERSVLLNSLACTKETWILARYLEISMDPNTHMKKQDVALVLSYIGENEMGRHLVLNYLNEHWSEIYPYQQLMRGELLNLATREFNTKTDLKNVENFLKSDARDLDSNHGRGQQVLTTIRDNVRWMEASYDAIVQWLEEKGYSSEFVGV